MTAREREAFLDIGGVRIWTARSGEGPPVLLLSGGPGCCDYMAPVAAMIRDRTEVVRIEQRGCGRSDPDPPYRLRTTIADLEAVRHHLGLERWIVGGHSWGADLALAYALAYPARTKGLVYIAGKGFQNDRDWSAEYHAARGRRGETEPDQAFPPNMAVNTDLNAEMKRYLKRPALWREIADLDLPSLFVAGGRDIRPYWPIEQLAATIRGARFALIEDAAHVVWRDGAGPLRAHLRGFLDTV